MPYIDWEQTIEEAFDDAKIVATPEQIATVVGWLEGAYDNRNIASGHDVYSYNHDSHVSDLSEKRLAEAREYSDRVLARTKYEYEGKIRDMEIRISRLQDRLGENNR